MDIQVVDIKNSEKESTIFTTKVHYPESLLTEGQGLPIDQSGSWFFRNLSSIKRIALLDWKLLWRRWKLWHKKPCWQACRTNADLQKRKAAMMTRPFQELSVKTQFFLGAGQPHWSMTEVTCQEAFLRLSRNKKKPCVGAEQISLFFFVVVWWASFKQWCGTKHTDSLVRSGL